jgi:hypothetical protein
MVTSKDHVSTPEEKAAKREYAHRHYLELTPEKRAEYLAKQRAARSPMAQPGYDLSMAIPEDKPTVFWCPACHERIDHPGYCSNRCQHNCEVAPAVRPPDIWIYARVQRLTH